MGELYIGGGQVARGYHANPELTKTSFVYTKDGQRLYKSGDMVRMLGNGHFEYLGRKDDQVKLRGLRVELAEINNVIKDGHPSISEVSTQVLKYSSMSQEQLVVFLGLPEMDGSERTPIVEEAARSIAKKKLPNYMVPHIYITIQSLPRSTAGKLDKKALLEVFKESQAEKFEEHNNTGDAKPVRAWSKDESTILRVLSNLSGIKDESIGHNMTIYELGLDSISAVQIAAQLRNKGMEIFTGDVIEVMWMNNLQNTILTKTQHPTISQLATFAGKNDRQQTPKLPGFNFAAFDKKHRKAICESLSIASHDLQIIRPCTPVQAGMIAQFLNSSGALYFNSLTMKLAQHVDIPALKDAWKAATAKYQMLRTGFANVNDIDHPFAMLTFNSNFAGLPWTERHTPLIRPATPANQGIESAIDVHQSLHLPTWRLRLEEAQGSRHLHFSALHALYDGQALQTILADVASIYHGHGTNIEMPFESTISTILDGSMSDANSSADFWRAYGTGTYIINFPNMAPLHEESKTIQVLSRTCSFTRSRLKGFCRHRGVTMQAAGQAAWARVLSAYTGESSVTFGLG